MIAEFVLLSFANYCEVKMFKIEIDGKYFVCCYKSFFNFTDAIKDYKKYIKKNFKGDLNAISQAQEFLKNYLHHEITDLYVFEKEFSRNDLWFLEDL